MQTLSETQQTILNLITDRVEFDGKQQELAARHEELSEEHGGAAGVAVLEQALGGRAAQVGRAQEVGKARLVPAPYCRRAQLPDHPQVRRVEGSNLDAHVDKGVVDELGLDSDLMARDQRSPLAELDGESLEPLVVCGGSAAVGHLSVAVEQAPNACPRVDVDAKVLHVFLRSG